MTTPITRESLAIFKAEQLGSSPDAGGQRTKIKVTSGKLNELFPAISDIDHAASALDIVKCYPALDTAGTPVLLDGHVFISEPPTDPLVSMIIAEDATLDDADRMTDMVDILESSVRASQLIRKDMTGLLAGQDSFPAAYLQTMYRYNDRDYWANVTLQQGQVICLTVEYEGAEHSRWPRFEHYCQIQKTVSGGQEGQVFFQPPIPFDTPDAGTVINGEKGCSKLRYTSENPGIKYHGVTKLTAPNASNSNKLAVRGTNYELLPKVRTVAHQVNVALEGVQDSGGNAGSAQLFDLVYKTASQPSVKGRTTYIFELADLLTDEAGLQAVGARMVIGSPTLSGGNLISTSVTGNTVTLTYSGSNADGQPVSVQYVPAPKYATYLSSAPFPNSRQLVAGRLVGEVDFVSNSYPNIRAEIKPASANAPVNAVPVVEAGGRVMGHINAKTGVFTKAELDFRGDFSLSFNALLEATAGGQPVGDTVVNFALKTAAPILDSFYMTVSSAAGSLISASSNSAGVIAGAGVSGTIKGNLVELTFTDYVRLSTLRYDIAETVTLSPPPELYKLNPLRIKNAGVVEIFTPWTPVSIQHTNTQVLSNPAAAQTKTVRPNARFVDITDAEGKSLWTLANSHYSWNKATGVVTINSNFAGFTAPFILTDTIGEVALVTEVAEQTLTLAAPLSQEYPVGSNVSSVQNLGDLQARIGTVRDMTSWAGNWDTDGTGATGNLNTVDYPIEVNNNAAVNEDWLLLFTSPTAFRCIGKRLGQIAIGDTLNDFAPINPLTLAPYFVIRQGAFGGGWQTGEAIRFKSVAASKPIMLLRTVQSGHSQITTDRTVIALRGNES